MEKKDKNLNVPNLRFPEFSGEWETSILLDVCEINPKTPSLDEEFVYIDLESVEKGTILHENVISRDDAPSRAQRVLKFNDILFQCVRPYQKNNLLFAGYTHTLQYVASTGYAQIRTDKQNPAFLYQLLNTQKFVDQVMLRCTGTSYPAINANDLSKIPICYPLQIEEQNKIAKLLSLLDNRIETQKKIIEKYESLIRGLITDVNKGKTCKCKAVALRDVLIEVHEKNVENHEVCSVSVRQGVINQIDYLGRSFAAKEVLHYNVVNYGDIVYTKSPTGEFPYGIVKRSNLDRLVAVSPLYGVYRPVNDYVGIYLHLYFKSPVNTKNYLHRLIQKGAKNTINITNQHFLDNEILIPENGWLEIIVNAASTIEKMIHIECNALLCLEKQKNYLLSKMFI